MICCATIEYSLKLNSAHNFSFSVPRLYISFIHFFANRNPFIFNQIRISEHCTLSKFSFLLLLRVYQYKMSDFVVKMNDFVVKKWQEQNDDLCKLIAIQYPRYTRKAAVEILHFTFYFSTNLFWLFWIVEWISVEPSNVGSDMSKL